jgi:antitoxin CptB
MSATDLDLFEELLEENDQDLYAWATGQAQPPGRLADLVARMGRYAGDKFAQQSNVL